MNKYIAILITAMLPAFIFSQEQEKVDGVVLDSEGSNALGLSGANVYWQDSQTGVVTNFDGEFSIPYLRGHNKYTFPISLSP